MANLQLLSDLRTYFQTIVSDTNIDSTLQDDFLNQAHEFTAYSYPWAFMKRLYAKNILAYESQYDLPSDWREFDTLRVAGVEYEEMDREQLRKNNNAFAIERVANEIIINSIPTTDQDTTTVTNIETAAADVLIEVADASIFAKGDEVYIDNSTNPQTAILSAIDTSANTVTATINFDTAASDSIWVLNDGIVAEYFKTATKLSGASDTTDLPVWLRPRIVEYAAYLYFLYLQDARQAANWLATYNTRIKDHRVNLAFQTSMGGIKFSIRK